MGTPDPTQLKNLKMLVAGVIVFVVLSLPLIIVTLQLFVLRTSSAPTYGIQGLGIILETFIQISGYQRDRNVFAGSAFYHRDHAGISYR